VVLVQDTTEDASSPYGRVHRYDDTRVVVGRTLIQALMWPVAVEVALVCGQHDAGVPFVVDQHVVGALPADTADELRGHGSSGQRTH